MVCPIPYGDNNKQTNKITHSKLSIPILLCGGIKVCEEFWRKAASHGDFFNGRIFNVTFDCVSSKGLEVLHMYGCWTCMSCCLLAEVSIVHQVAPVCSPYYTVSWAFKSQTSKRHLDRFRCFCTKHCPPIGSGPHGKGQLSGDTWHRRTHGSFNRMSASL